MSYFEKKYLSYRTNEYATHQPFLWHYLKKTNKPILELGSGYGSTPLLHAYSACHNIPLYTLDHDKEWLANFSSYESDLHNICHVDVSGGWEAFEAAIPNAIEWGLVFIDQGSWESRVNCARLLRSKAEYILIHDCDCVIKSFGLGKVIKDIVPYKSQGVYDVSEDFSYSVIAWPDFPWPTSSGPPTLIASNKHESLSMPSSGELEKDIFHYLEFFKEPS